VKKYAFILLILTIFLSACTSPANPLARQWKLVSYGPAEAMTTAVPDADATLTFAEDGTVAGSSGCNSLSGEYTVEGSQITFNALTTTLMACDEPRMDQESAVTQVLNGTADYGIEDQTLTINHDGMLLVFTSVSAE
jgi:heat shock protein HslJ